jgi:hypothetical protein
MHISLIKTVSWLQYCFTTQPGKSSSKESKTSLIFLPASNPEAGPSAQFRTPSLDLHTIHKRHHCPHYRCFRHYARKGDLTRHIAAAHTAPSRFHCHLYHCPRSILGRGFPRKDKLIEHLMSNKHRLSHQDAVCQAVLHNLPTRDATTISAISLASRIA